MPERLKKSWVAALATTALLFAVSVAMVRGDGAEPGSETLPALSPSGGEVAMTTGAAVLVFVALWALYSLVARSISKVKGERRIASAPRDPEPPPARVGER